MKRNRLLLIAVGVALFAVAQTAKKAISNQYEDYTSQIRELRLERRDALADAVDSHQEHWGNGLGNPAGLVVAKAQLIEEELNLADSPERRIELLEENVRQFESLLEVVRQQVDVGAVGIVGLIEAEIWLIEAKSKLLHEQQSQEETRSRNIESPTPVDSSSNDQRTIEDQTR